MKKVKELLAKLKQKALGVLDAVARLLGLTQPEVEPVRHYSYEIVAVHADQPIQDCCEHESVPFQPNYEDFDGVEEILKPVRKARKKASKKKLVKKKKPTNKNK